MPFPYTFPFPFEFPGGAPAGGAVPLLDAEGNPTQADGSAVTHGARAIDRLAQYLKTQPNVISLLTALCLPAEEMESTFQDLISYRSIDLGFGEHLNVIGDIVRQAREGLSDDDYRLRLRARVKLNIGSGTTEDIYGLFELIKPAGTTLKIKDEPPAGFTLLISGEQTATEAALMLYFLRLARAAGVRGILEWWESAPADMFTLDGAAGQGLDEGHLAGAAI